MLDLILKLFEDSLLLFALHFESAGAFPKPLSAKEERQCFEAFANGDSKAKEKLISHNLRLVAHIIKKYYATSADIDDLISIGTIGLIKAVQTFDYTKGTRFATYASRCVENEILMHFRSIRKSSSEVFFTDTLDTDKDGNTLSLADIIADDTDVSEQVDLKINSQKLRRYIDELLDEREKLIISMRYGLGGDFPLTQREVAKKLGISRSYVSRIEKKAVEKLRVPFGL
ncbi:MAG: RNA polymerase sporulation sigma factor SigK [Oscillospiraceae bacterium]|nr:RNA polymerase sporulation sigma factor SigK [Oscillospiraceae bacterium]